MEGFHPAQYRSNLNLDLSCSGVFCIRVTLLTPVIFRNINLIFVSLKDGKPNCDK